MDKIENQLEFCSTAILIHSDAKEFREGGGLNLNLKFNLKFGNTLRAESTKFHSQN